MDNNLKSVPQRKLLRDDQKSILQFSQRIWGVWQSDRGMQGEIKEKHPCESEGYAKALRHLLVQYKESVSLSANSENKLHNSTSYHEEEEVFFISAQNIYSSPQTLRVWSSCESQTFRHEDLTCLIQGQYDQFVDARVEVFL